MLQIHRLWIAPPSSQPVKFGEDHCTLRSSSREAYKDIWSARWDDNLTGKNRPLLLLGAPLQWPYTKTLKAAPKSIPCYTNEGVLEACLRVSVVLFCL